MTNDLVKFNQEFQVLAAAAMPTMGEWAIKEQYVKSVIGKTGIAIRTNMRQPLQHIMATALDLFEARKGISVGPGSNGGMIRTQNPNRILCSKCHTWHMKDGPCKKTEGNRQAPPNRNLRPRAHEVEILEDQEECLAVEEMEHEVAEEVEACSDAGSDF